MSDSVTLAFLHVSSPLLAAHWMNSAAAKAAEFKGQKPYVHIEIIFPDLHSYSITSNTQVVHKVSSKTFSRNEWEFLKVKLGVSGVRSAQFFCDRAHASKCGFNWVGFTLAPVLGWGGGGRNFFCSELCAAALRAGGMCLDAAPESYTPAALYQFVRNKSQTHSTVKPGALNGFQFEF